MNRKAPNAKVSKSCNTLPDAPPLSALPVARPAELALTIAWSEEEPHRVGEIAFFPLDETVTLGRPDETDEDRVAFFRQRPRSLEPTPPLADLGISRRQLHITRRGDGLHVERERGPAMLVNGTKTERAIVRADDTIEIAGSMILLCVERSPAMARLVHAGVESAHAFGEPDAHAILGESAAAWAIRDDIAAAAKIDSHVMIFGPSGTGKELTAQAIHASSRRPSKVFVAQNASSLPEGVAAMELFGCGKGYPNGGSPARVGLVALADGGTLFLDEIGELAKELQAHLLRTLDQGDFKPLGESKARVSIFRFIGATNREQTALKYDVLGRLGVEITLPGLDARREDIPLFVRAIVIAEAKKSPDAFGKFLREVGGRAEVKIEPAFMVALLRRSYTLNVREIGKLLKRAMKKSPGTTLRLPADMSPWESTPPPVAAAAVSAEAAVAPAPSGDLTEADIRAAIARNAGNVACAARELGVSRQALYRIIKKRGVEAT